MDWKSHVHVNKLGNSWKDRDELTSVQRTQLLIRMQVNYYGFWAGKLIHLYAGYKAYRLGMFANEVSNKTFWMRFLTMTGGLLLSVMYTDKLMRVQLFIFCEDMREKYGSELDQLRVNYLKDKAEKRMIRHTELQRLADLGKNVTQLRHKN